MYTIITMFLSILLFFGGIHPATDHPIRFQNPDEVRMAFVAVSDTHVCNTPYSQTFTSLVFEDVANSGLHVNAYVNCGDLADNGAREEYDRFYSVVRNQSAIDHPILALGNHDARFALSGNAARFRSEVESLLGIQTGGKNYYSYAINGCTFIALGTEKQLQLQAYFSEEQLSFLDQALEEAAKTGKPSFVICHQPLNGTHGTAALRSVGEQSDRVRHILCKYRNVFLLSGHIHQGFQANSLQKIADSVWSLNIPAYGKMQSAGGSAQRGAGYYAEVYDDAVVFTGRDFAKGQNVGVSFRCELAAEGESAAA